MSDRRRAKLADPTAERASDQSTQSASGLSGGQAESADDDRLEYPEDTVARDHRGVAPTPRRYDEG